MEKKTVSTCGRAARGMQVGRFGRRIGKWALHVDGTSIDSVCRNSIASRPRHWASNVKSNSHVATVLARRKQIVRPTNNQKKWKGNRGQHPPVCIARSGKAIATEKVHFIRPRWKSTKPFFVPFIIFHIFRFACMLDPRLLSRANRGIKRSHSDHISRNTRFNVAKTLHVLHDGRRWVVSLFLSNSKV